MRSPYVIPERFAPIRRKSYMVDEAGRILVDPAKRHVSPFTLLTEPEEVEVPGADPMGTLSTGQVLLRGGVVSQPAILPIDNKGPFELCYIHSVARFTAGERSGQPASQYTVVVYDPEFQPLLMNREIHVRTMAGGFGSSLGDTFGNEPVNSAGGRPLVLPETLFMEPEDAGRAIMVGFRNLTGDPIKVRMTFHGIRYYDLASYRSARKEKEDMYGKGRTAWPYFLTTDTNINMAADATNDFDIRITDEADMEIFKAAKYSDAEFLFRLMEKAGSRFLDSGGTNVLGSIHSSLGFGDAEFPFIPYETMYFERNYKLILRVSNTIGGGQNRIWPTFIGRRIGYAK